MQDKPWVYHNLSINDALTKIDELVEIYHEYGIVVIPGCLSNEETYRQYLSDVRTIFSQILQRYNISLDVNSDLADALVELSKAAPADARIISDLGTQPNKFISANRLKYSDFIVKFMYKLFGENAILTTPSAGDTLHLFMPGQAFHKYSLPIHQDYQYLMQSPKQATFYLGLSKAKQNCGGLEYWPKSHKLGILKSCRNEHGSFKVSDEDYVKNNFSSEEFFWNPGDIAIFDSLLSHRSIPNTSTDAGRVVQIFRYSDINNDVSKQYNWRSTVYPRRSVQFEDEHASLYLDET